MNARSPHGESIEQPHAARGRRSWLRRKLRDERGVAAVEFAILLPVLCAILLGMIDYGYYFFLNSVVINAAREGARAGVVKTTEALAETEGAAVATAYLSTANVGVGSCFNCADTPTAVVVGENLVVTVTVDPYTPLTGFLPSAALPARAMHTSTMRAEGFLP